MEEKTFFEHGDVKVTNSRFIAGGQTYVMSNVTSVKSFVQKPDKVGGIVLLIIGLVFVAIGLAATFLFYLGIVLVAVAAFVLNSSQKSVYHVMLTTSGGEVSALKTYQLDYITKVVNALNEAIVHRG